MPSVASIPHSMSSPHGAPRRDEVPHASLRAVGGADQAGDVRRDPASGSIPRHRRTRHQVFRPLASASGAPRSGPVPVGARASGWLTGGAAPSDSRYAG